MTEALLVGLVIAAGAPWLFVGVLLAGMIEPWIGLVALGALFVLKREQPARWSNDVRFSRGVADEMRGGSSLRRALAVAAEEINESRLARACRIGRPYDELAGEVEACLPLVGSAAGAAIRIGGESGGRVADAFEAIALMAADEQELKNERRAATAQARVSALIIAALPVLLLGVLVATGHLGVLLSSGPLSLGFMAAGFSLIAVGLIVIWRMVRRAEVV